MNAIVFIIIIVNTVIMEIKSWDRQYIGMMLRARTTACHRQLTI